MNSPVCSTSLSAKGTAASVDTPMTGDVEQTIRRALRGLMYGQITIAVQEGCVIQVDRSEHTRHFRNKRSHR